MVSVKRFSCWIWNARDRNYIIMCICLFQRNNVTGKSYRKIVAIG